MALTASQQTSILQLTQAMFKAAPGATYLEALGSQMTTGQSLANLAQSLVGNTLFFGKNYAEDLTTEAFADAFMNDLIGDKTSAADKTLATDYIVNRITAGATRGEVMTDAINILSAFPASDPNWGNAALAYNTANANKIVDNLVANTVSSDDKAGAVDYMLAQQAAGKTFGEIIEWAITTLDNMNHVDPVWGNAATLFDNRIEVSRYYSVEKSGASTSLSTLQQVLVGVTADVATVATAKTAIDNVLSNLPFNLANLDGSNGFKLDGVLASDDTGESVGSVGDINGDGFDDLIIGAPHNFDDFYSGASFVVFGKSSGFSATLPLSSLNGSNGFRINGVAGGDAAGNAVSSAGDINGDGIDDLLIGAPISDVPKKDMGYTYVVFGKSSGFNATMDLSTLDGSNGFRMSVAEDDLLLGWSVSSAGDVNGDKVADLIIGVPYKNTPNGDNTGSSYVVFGKTTGFDAKLDLSSLNGSNGFRMDGALENSYLGNGVSAGDINGDGFDDLIAGSYNAGTAGTTYVLFGKSSGFDAIVDLSNLDGINGFSIDGEIVGDQAGYSVDNAGDVNGDGFDDVIIGARVASINGKESGAAYVVFGKASGFNATVKLSDLDGSNGFRLEGVAAGNKAGRSVSTAGDFNNDGFSDLIVGAFGADSNGEDSGASYLIFGKSSGFGASINLGNLSSNEGFVLNGLAAGDSFGKSVSSAGDINNDGFDDLIVGAPFGDGVIPNTGVGYVIFGHSFANTAANLKISESDNPDNVVLNGYHTDIHDAAVQLVGVSILDHLM